MIQFRVPGHLASLLGRGAQSHLGRIAEGPDYGTRPEIILFIHTVSPVVGQKEARGRSLAGWDGVMGSITTLTLCCALGGMSPPPKGEPACRERPGLDSTVGRPRGPRSWARIDGEVRRNDNRTLYFGNTRANLRGIA